MSDSSDSEEFLKPKKKPKTSKGAGMMALDLTSMLGKIKSQQKQHTEFEEIAKWREAEEENRSKEAKSKEEDFSEEQSSKGLGSEEATEGCETVFSNWPKSLPSLDTLKNNGISWFDWLEKRRRDRQSSASDDNRRQLFKLVCFMPKPCVAEEALCTLKSNITKSKKLSHKESSNVGGTPKANRKRSRTGKKLNLSATSNSSKENWVPRLTDWLWAFKEYGLDVGKIGEEFPTIELPKKGIEEKISSDGNTNPQSFPYFNLVKLVELIEFMILEREDETPISHKVAIVYVLITCLDSPMLVSGKDDAGCVNTIIDCLIKIIASLETSFKGTMELSELVAKSSDTLMQIGTKLKNKSRLRLVENIPADSEFGRKVRSSLALRLLRHILPESSEATRKIDVFDDSNLTTNTNKLLRPSVKMWMRKNPNEVDYDAVATAVRLADIAHNASSRKETQEFISLRKIICRDVGVLVKGRRVSETEKAIQHDLELINFRYGRKQASRVND